MTNQVNNQRHKYRPLTIQYHFDSGDDYRSGCRNVSHCHQQFFSELHSPVSVWVFIAQLVKHCSAIAEATGLNLVEAPKNYYCGLLRNCLNCDSTAMVTSSFHLYSHSSHHFILYKWKHKILSQVKTGKHKQKWKHKKKTIIDRYVLTYAYAGPSSQ